MNSALKHIGVFLFFFILIFVINKVPEGFFISGGDFHQLLDINQNIDKHLYTWFDISGKGQYNPLTTTYPFYFIQKVLFNIGFSYSQISNFIMFQFLITSFYSFFFAQKLLFKELKTDLLGPLSYSLNLFTLGVLFYPWIITHHFLIYIFIPLLLSVFYKYLSVEEGMNKYFFYFSLIFVLSLPAYNNIAFLFSLFFVQGIIWGFSFLLGTNKKSSFSKFILLILGQLVIAFIIIAPFLSSQYGYKEYAVKSKALGGNSIEGFMSATSGNALNSFRLVIDKWRFPHTILNPRFEKIPHIFVVLSHTFSLVFILFILYVLAIKRKSIKNSNKYYIFLFSYLILLLLSFRLSGIFYNINLIFYKDLTLGILRSPDKLFSFIPFFTVLLFIYSINKLTLTKTHKYILHIVILLPVSFIFFGGIIKQYSYNINGYRQGIVKIPSEYYNIQDTINKDLQLNSIISIPYSKVNSIGWSNYQKWGYKGTDLLYLLYNKRYMSANSYDHITVNKASLKKFSSPYATLEELSYLIEKFGAKYIIDHKDVENRFLGLTDRNLQLLQVNNVISPVETNNFFDLYEINSDLITPLIGGDLMSFTKINPTQYKINLSIQSSKDINFLQSHNPQWKLFLNSSNDFKNCETKKRYREVIECSDKNVFYEGDELSYLYKKGVALDSHKMIYDYANTWNISKEDIKGYVDENYGDELKAEGYPKILENGKIDYKYYILNKNGSIDIELTLYFKPQSYFYLGLIISASTFSLLVLWLIISTIRNRYILQTNNTQGNKQ